MIYNRSDLGGVGVRLANRKTSRMVPDTFSVRYREKAYDPFSSPGLFNKLKRDAVNTCGPNKGKPGTVTKIR